MKKKKVTKKKSVRKSKAKPESPGVTPITPIRLSEEDRARLQRKAKRWAKGNLSAWLRHAGGRYTPKPGEKIKIKVG